MSFAEIEKNEFNLNLPRYIDSQEPEDTQDIAGHLCGGIPNCDIAALEKYWPVLPGLKSALFHPLRDSYAQLSILHPQLKQTIYEHPEFVTFTERMNALFAAWRQKSAATLKALQAGSHPKEVIAALAEDLLAHYAGKPLIDKYDVYQHLMDSWAETMQDNCYLIAADGTPNTPGSPRMTSRRWWWTINGSPRWMPPSTVRWSASARRSPSA